LTMTYLNTSNEYNIEDDREPMLGDATIAKVNGDTTELPNQNWNIYLVFICMVFVISSFQFGYATGVVNSPQKYIMCGSFNINNVTGETEEHPTRVLPSPEYNNTFFKDCVPMTDTEWFTFVAMFPLGGLIGGLSGGPIADLIGRRNTLFFNNLFFIIAYVLMSLFSNFEVLAAGRFIVGVGAGVTTSIVNMYLSEISPVKLRGAIGVLPQLGIVIGILVSQLLAIPLASGGRPWQWRLLLGWVTTLPLIQMILLPFCPESPKFLLVNKRNSEAALAAFRKLRRSKDVEQEFELVKRQELETQVQQASALVRIKALFRRELLKPLLVAIVLQMAQQLSGVNVVFSYSKDIFKSASLSDSQADLCTVLVGLINVICTIVVVPLMDRMGRRTLLLIGEVGCFTFFTTLAVCFIIKATVAGANLMAIGVISVICVIGFVISFAISLGPIPWLIISEIFPSDVRPFAVSIASTINWLCNFAVLMIFPIMKRGIKQYTFIPFASIILLSFLFTVFFVMETKGKTVEQIVGLSSAVEPSAEKKGLLTPASPEYNRIE